MRVLYHNITEYHAITVLDTKIFENEKGRFRILQFSEDAVQGILDLNTPERVLFEYPRAMIHLMNQTRPDFENAFMIGLGIGTLPRYFSDKHFKIAELDGKLVEISTRYFACDLADIHIGDGRQVLENEPAGLYAFIIIDAFTAEGTPQHLATLQSFRMIQEKLDSEGVLLLNLIAKGTQDKQACAIFTTLQTVFAVTHAFALPIKGSPGLLNMVVAASNRPLHFQQDAMAGFREVILDAGELAVDE